MSATTVLLVLGTSTGGVARHVGQVSRVLHAAGYRVEVAGPLATRALIGDAGVDVFRPLDLGDRPGVGDPAVLARLRRAARHADVVHAHGLRAGSMAALALRSLGRRSRPRLVVTLHNRTVGGPGVRLVGGVLARIVARTADAVLGVSGDLVRGAAARGARQAERALVPAPTAAVPSRPRELVRASLGLRDGLPLVLTIARLAPQKDPLLVAAAAARLVRRGALFRWAVAGDGPLRGAISTAVDLDGLPVDVLGARADVPDLIAAADLVVVTSLWEGQSLVVQEALALGAPLVATDVGGTAELTGEAAVLVPPHRADVLATAVADLLADPVRREALARAGLRRAALLPDSDDLVAQLRRVYARPPARAVDL